MSEQPSLATLQDAFQTFLLGGNAAIAAQVVGTVEAPVPDRLGVYANAYLSRLTEALGTDYPKLKVLMGDEDFMALAHAYAARFPSAHPSLRWFGQRLAAFLRSSEPYAGRPLLADMAEFEWSMGEAFDARDADRVTVEAMSGIPAEQWAGLRFAFQPALRRLAMHWNVPALWTAIERGHPPPEAARSVEPEAWLMWRSDLKIYWRTLPADETAAVDAARNGVEFGEICELMCAHVAEADAPLRAASLLRQWLTDGIVSAIHSGS